MKLQTATRLATRMRLGIQGPSGSGKTIGSLHVGYGLCEDWSKIAVVDTEHGSASLYADLGRFQTLILTPPFTPERYRDAIKVCERSGISVIIIDSLSHAWEGPGGILDIHSSMTGNSFTNWSKVTPRHNALVQDILQSPCHIIVTLRSKQEYVLTEKNGKQVPEKVGMKGIQREGLDYELTALFELDAKHQVAATKDRTSLFADQPPFRLTTNIGKTLLSWCRQGTSGPTEEELVQRIKDAEDVPALVALFNANPSHQVSLHDHFKERKLELQNTAKFSDSLTLNLTEHE